MLVFSTFLSNLSLLKKTLLCNVYLKKKKKLFREVSEHEINHQKNHAPFFTRWSPSEGSGNKKTENFMCFFFHMIFILVILTNGEGLRFFLAHF